MPFNFDAASYYSAERNHARIYATFVEAIKSINELCCHPIGHLDLLALFQLRFGGSDWCVRANEAE